MPTKRFAPKIDWEMVWIEFNAWYDSPQWRKECSKCKQTHFNHPEWPDQEKKIEELVKDNLTLAQKRGK